MTIRFDRDMVRCAASGSFEFVAFSGGVNGRLTIPKYESHHPVCLDVEWLLPTLFDASLLTFEPPPRRLFFRLQPGSSGCSEASTARTIAPLTLTRRYHGADTIMALSLRRPG
jgi:hypothetical protein